MSKCNQESAYSERKVEKVASIGKGKNTTVALYWYILFICLPVRTARGREWPRELPVFTCAYCQGSGVAL